jgi:SAM-dependent methyltransferase
MDEQAEFLSDVRKNLSYRFLKGRGIEIGALHAPLPVSSNTQVRYVDCLPIESLVKRYPELDGSKFIRIDIIDDGEFLSQIPDNSEDFIIGNHFIEHCENPLGTLRNHLKKIKPGGFLYYSIPDKDLTFDNVRPLTEFDHLVSDDLNGPSVSRKDHFFEWVYLLEGERDEERVEARAKVLMDTHFSIHFHVWDKETIFQCLFKSYEYLNRTFRVLHFEQYGIEVIIILQKK